MIFRVCRGMVLAALLLAAGGCCWPGMRRGDARTTICRPLIGYRDQRDVNVSLPKVRLDRPHERRFRVRGLPDREWPHRGGWQMSLTDPGALATLQDYDLVVAVIKPSQKRFDSGEIRGRGVVGGPKPVRPAS